MPGVMWNAGGEHPGVESTGSFLGILKRDPVETFQEFKMPFIDVFIPDLFSEEDDYPLTFIPTHGLMLPLRKDDEVWVRFNQDNISYPVLHKYAVELDGDMVANPVMPEKAKNIVPPEWTDDTLIINVFRFSPDYWIVITETFSFWHIGANGIIIDTGGDIFTVGTTVQHLSAGDLVLESSGSGKFIINNKDKDFKTIMDTFLSNLDTHLKNLSDHIQNLADHMQNLSSAQTVGSPANHAFNPGSISNFIATQGKMNTDKGKVDNDKSAFSNWKSDDFEKLFSDAMS